MGALYELADYKDRGIDAPTLGDGRVADGALATARWSVRVYGRYKLAGGKLALTHDLIVIPSFRATTDDYRILAFGALEAPIAKGFAVRIQSDATREGPAAAAVTAGQSGKPQRSIA